MKLLAKTASPYNLMLFSKLRLGLLTLLLVHLSFGSVLAQPATKLLSLDDAISTALGRGEEIQLAKASVKVAEGGEEVARSGMLPQISANGNYTRTIQSQYSGLSSLPDTGVAGALAKIFSSFPFGKANQWTFALNASQNIYTGGRLTALADAAEARKHSADIDLTAAEAQLVLNVTQSYYDAVLADTLLQISRDALAEAEEADRETELQYKAGDKAEFDALRSRVAKENQIPVVLQSENDRAQAFYRLKQLLNYSLDDSLILTTPVVDSLARFAMTSDSATEERSSVVQARLNIKAQDAQVRLAESAHWPQISISTSYSPVAYPDNIFPNNNDWFTNWTASLNVSIPIYTGGNISGNVDEAIASVDQASARLEQTREAAAFDSRVAFDNLHTFEANLRSTTSTSAEATRAYEIARVRFTQGISTQLELDDSRVQEEQARANWARAMRNYQVARAKLSLLKNLPVTQQSAQASTTMSQPSQPAAISSPGTQQQTGTPTGQ